MTWQTICDPLFSGRLCMTLVHSIWQVALLAAIAWGLGWFWQRRSVQGSYAVHVAALIAGLAAMPVTYAFVDVSVPGTVPQSELTSDTIVPLAPSAAWKVEDSRSLVDQGEPAPKPRNSPTVPDAADTASVTVAAKEPSAWWPQAAPWIVTFYLAGVLLMLVRLIGGTWRANRLGSKAQLIGDGALVEKLSWLARKWSMRIVPVLARAEGIVVPRVVGLVRPMIVLPVSLITCLSTDELEMILAHELAHVRRHDMWVNLAQRVAEVVLFFNPALWYLSRRVSALREYCCDELTCRAMSGSDRELRARYASALLRIVELGRRGAAHGAHARMFESGDLATLAAAGRSPSDLRRRVARLFGEPIHEPVRLSRGGLLSLGVLIAVLLVAPTAWHSAAERAAAPTANVAEERETKAPDGKTFRGKVLDESGMGVADADVWLSVYCDPRGAKARVQHVKSDSQGRFTLAISAAWVADKTPDSPVTFWVYAPGHQLGIKHSKPVTEFSFGDNASNLVIQLKPAADTSFVVLDPSGQPLAGALVQPNRVTFETTPEEVLQRIEARTDAAGRAKFSAVGREELDEVRIVAKGYGIQNQRYSSPERPLPAENAIRLRPVGRVEGRVTADKPEWVRGARMVLVTDRVDGHAPPWLTDGFAEVESDDQGRFAVPLIANGRLRFDLVRVDEELPVRPQLPQFVDVEANATTELVLPMTRLVPVRGSVRVKDRDMPVLGAKVYINYGIGRQMTRSTSDTQGQFTARVLPGRVTLSVFDRSHTYAQLGHEISCEIPNQTEDFKLPPLEVVPTKTVAGSVVDENGQPVANAYVSFVVDGRPYGFGESDGNGRFEVLGVPAAIDTAAAEYVVQGSDPKRRILKSKVVKPDPLILGVEMPSPANPPRRQTGTTSGPPSALPATPRKASAANPDGKRVDLAVVVARHVLLLDGKEIITWAELEKKIAALPDPSQAYPHFYTTRGAYEAGVEKRAKEQMWRLHQKFKLKGHSEGSLWQRADFRYDGIKTAKDLVPDESLRVKGRIVDGKGGPVAGAEVLLVMPVDKSTAYTSYDIALVQGRVRNPLEEILTHSDDQGQFSLYPPKGASFYVVALHPKGGFNLARSSQFTTSGEVRLLPWATLVSKFAEEAGQRQEASLRTRVREADGFPEMIFNQYWVDLKQESPIEEFRFTHVPPIFETTISGDFPGEQGSSFSLPGATVSLLPGESRRLDLAPLSDKQREYLEWLRKESAARQARPSASPAPSSAPTQNSHERFELQIMGPDGKPVPQAAVEVRVEPKPMAAQIQQGQFLKIGPYGTLAKTDTKGQLVVALPKKPNHFALKIDQPGFGPYWAEWGSDLHAAIPSRFTAELEAGWTLGGVIVNTGGAPIVGAKVHPAIKFKKRPGDFNDLSLGTGVTTDARGRWSFASVPASMNEVFVEISHPDYKPNRQPLTRSQFGIESGGEPNARITLRQGLAVTGSVRDESGKPIAGATVRTKFLNDLRQATTGPDGAYRLVGCEPGMARIVVSAVGKARDFQEVRVEPDMKPVDFVMKRGGTIRIRVLDDQGRPVAKTRIFFQRWRGPIRYFEFNEVNQYADQQGVWQWSEAPLDEIRADICPPGGMQLLTQPLRARQQEYVFRLPPPLVISGDVADAVTGQPIKRFRVVPGIRSGEANASRLNWVRNEGFEAVDGHYQLRPGRGEPAHLVRIEADGYEVAASRDIKSDEGKVRIDFRLKPAGDIAATIVTPAGRPATGAKVALGIAGSQINIQNGDISDGGTYAARGIADPTGRFRFPSQGADFRLVITHPSGFAHLIKKSTDKSIPSTIRLTPWARVDGTFRVGQRTVPNVGISLNTNAVHSYGPDAPSIFPSYDVTTQAGGRFVFERVFPGEGWIGRRILLMVSDGATEVTSSKRVPARFVSGETTKLDLGGTGRPVTGRLAPPADFREKALWNFALVSAQVDFPQPKSPPVPADVQNSPERRNAWWKEWKATDEGKAWQAAYETHDKLLAASPYFTASVDRDGSFRIDDMPPGKYVLSVRFSRHEAGHLSGYRFSVPEAGSAEAGRPIDLGVLTLERP